MYQDPQLNTPTTSQNWKTNYSWDFFLSHSGADKAEARILYDALTPPAKVFLDGVSMIPGDDFDISLPKALKGSLISIILISPNTEQAYYEQEEIAMAIQISRADPDTHRVVPVYINAVQSLPPASAPFGLTRKHSLYITNATDINETRQILLLILETMKKQEIKKDHIVEKYQEAVAKITNPSNKTDMVSGFKDITGFIRIPLIVLSVIFIVNIILLVTAAVIKLEQKGLVLGVLASLAVFTLSGIFWLISKSLSHAPQIAKGKINGN